MTDPTQSDEVPAFMLDLMNEVWAEHAARWHRHAEEAFEHMKHTDAQNRALQVHIYEQILEMLDNPQAGPDLVKKLIRGQIDIIRQFDQEEE